MLIFSCALSILPTNATSGRVEYIKNHASTYYVYFQHTNKHVTNIVAARTAYTIGYYILQNITIHRHLNNGIMLFLRWIICLIRPAIIKATTRLSLILIKAMQDIVRPLINSIAWSRSKMIILILVLTSTCLKLCLEEVATIVAESNLKIILVVLVLI
jgi:hypothetical protein